MEFLNYLIFGYNIIYTSRNGEIILPSSCLIAGISAGS